MASRNKTIKCSETIEITRSAITLNPYNPKRHSDQQVKNQVKNIKANGYLGGIVWNRSTGNLIDGHRRVQALDIINKYDGSNDYTIKVEVVDFDDKTEKEQMTYMALGNSKADYNLVAAYVDDIDISSIGISDEEASILRTLAVDATEVSSMADMSDMFIAQPTNEPSRTEQKPMFDIEKEEASFEEIYTRREEMAHDTADNIKAKKEKSMDVATARNESRDTYIMLHFDGEDDQLAFCEECGLEFKPSLIVNGIELLRRMKEK